MNVLQRFGRLGRRSFFGFIALTIAIGTSLPVLTAHAESRSIQLLSGGSGQPQHKPSNHPAISDDGRYVVFASEASNLVQQNTQNTKQIFLHDRQTNTTTLVSVNGQGQLAGKVTGGIISANNRYVAFDGVFPGDELQGSDANHIYVKDLQTGNIELATPRYTTNGFDWWAGPPEGISDDGRFVVFQSRSNVIMPNITGPFSNQFERVYVRDTVTDTYALASSTASGQPASGHSYNASISGDGRYTLFTSASTDLDLGRPPEANVFPVRRDVYLKDLQTGAVAVAARGPNGEYGNDRVTSGVLSADGNYLVFASTATNFGFSLTSSRPNLYLKNRVTGQLTLVSSGRDFDDLSLDDRSPYSISSSNEYVVSQSGQQGVLWTRTGGLNETVPADLSNFGTLNQALSDDGQAVFGASNNLLAADTNNADDVYVYGYLPDGTAPTVMGTPDRAPNTAGWYDNNVTINWQATDPAPSSGDPTDPPDTTADQEGVHTYTSAQSCDPAGNCATGSLELKIDKTNPVASNPSLSANPQVEGNETTLSIDAADAASGVAGGEYFVGADPGEGLGSAMTLTGNSLNATFGSDLEPGTYSVSARVRDNAGNWSTIVTAELEILHNDVTPPVFSYVLSAQPNAQGWYNGNVLINWQATDPEPSSGTPTDPADTVAATEGHNVTYTSAQSCDPAGNCATGSVQLSIDKTPPTTNNLNVGCVNLLLLDCVMLRISPATRTFTAGALDGLSGIQRGEFYIDTDPGQGNGTPMTLNGSTFTGTVAMGTPLGTHTLYVRAQDKAGNWSQSISRGFFMGLF